MRIDLTGRRFGRLTVVSFWGRRTAYKKLYWNCVCDCGVEKVVQSQVLVTGHALSCGCLHRERNSEVFTTHGWSQSGCPIYAAWEKMRSRCSPRSDCRKYYYDRGITVDPAWDDFTQFRRDMEPTWRKGLELDRINTYRGYSAGNCRWTDRIGQMNNTTRNRKYGFRGAQLTAHQIARLVNAPPLLLHGRLRKGWLMDRAINEPKRGAP